MFQQIIARMQREDGCDAVVLGCTEIPLILSDANSPLPTLDSTRCWPVRRCDGPCRLTERNYLSRCATTVSSEAMKVSTARV